MKRFVLDRRTFLRGAGAALALPWLEAMLGRSSAAADTLPPRRFAVFFFGNGVRLNRFVPADYGANWTPTEELAPLAAAGVKEYCSVVSGYDVKLPNVRGHHSGETGVLSCVPLVELPHAEGSFSSKFGGPSLDQVVATHVGAGTTYPSLQVGISKRVVTSEGPTLQYISHRGPDQPLPPEYDPSALYARLFGGFTPGDPTDPTARLRVSVLDVVKGDLSRLQARLGTADRARLDAHLTGVRQLETRLAALPPVFTSGCVLPGAVSARNQDVDGVEPIVETSHAMADLVALAFACDLTRVASVMFSGSVGQTVFTDVGAASEQHGLTHDEGQQELVHRTVVYTVEQYAYLLRRLKETPEGAGNLLDNSLVLLTSDCAEGLTHSNDDYPMVIGGKAGGALRHPGVHHRAARGNLTDVVLATLQAAGAPLTEFGAGPGYSSTPCRPILSGV